MACGSCQKKAKERAEQMRKQAELLERIQSQPSQPATEKVLPDEVKIDSANTAYFEAKMKLFGKL